MKRLAFVALVVTPTCSPRLDAETIDLRACPAATLQANVAPLPTEGPQWRPLGGFLVDCSGTGADSSKPWPEWDEFLGPSKVFRVGTGTTTRGYCMIKSERPRIYSAWRVRVSRETTTEQPFDVAVGLADNLGAELFFRYDDSSPYWQACASRGAAAVCVPTSAYAIGEWHILMISADSPRKRDTTNWRVHFSVDFMCAYGLPALLPTWRSLRDTFTIQSLAGTTNKNAEVVPWME